MARYHGTVAEHCAVLCKFISVSVQDQLKCTLSSLFCNYLNEKKKKINAQVFKITLIAQAQSIEPMLEQKDTKKKAKWGNCCYCSAIFTTTTQQRLRNCTIKASHSNNFDCCSVPVETFTYVLHWNYKPAAKIRRD